jgi:transcription initiation factor TFIIH subunit 4
MTCKLGDRIEYQLPNLIVGAITKESLYNAFENGITAEQVMLFELATLEFLLFSV